MNFVVSLFTLEINQRPFFVFESKWASEAEDIGFGWALENAEQITTKGSHGTNLPAVIKVRIARAAERTAYLAESDKFEFYQGIKVVYLSAPSSSEPG